MSMILLEPANKINHTQAEDQAADHLSNTFLFGVAVAVIFMGRPPLLQPHTATL
jgi:hypothetical protein